jgi:hypothetical protein
MTNCSETGRLQRIVELGVVVIAEWVLDTESVVRVVLEDIYQVEAETT